MDSDAVYPGNEQLGVLLLIGMKICDTGVKPYEEISAAAEYEYMNYVCRSVCKIERRSRLSMPEGKYDL